MRIAFATSTTHREFDEDLPLLLAAAAEQGQEAVLADWDDADIQWSSFDVVVVRSCWDYIARLEEFLAWVRSVPRIRNPAQVIEWNTDKVYLRSLAEAGVPTIPTFWNVRDGDPIGTHDDWVCKPSVSAGSMNTGRWSTRDEVYAHSAAIMAAGQTSIVQPYIRSVDSDGETAMLFIGGEFSHSIRKGQLLRFAEGINDDRSGTETITPRAPTAVQHEVAAEALATARDLLGLDRPLLYARVDLVTDEDGSPLVIELELTEPSLFLPHSQDGAAALIRTLQP